jgi:eukaryotic-like serine/threonine-protein kinase
MQPERWPLVEQIFHAALEREPSERAEFVAESCRGDESLRQEVESLLASHEQAAGFIEVPAGDAAAELLAEHEARLKTGTMLNRYKILDLLGKGGMGEVYLAEDTKLSRKIALKLLPPQFTISADRMRRFEHEARAVSALNHPNIVTIHEIEGLNGANFIVTEFVDGQTLRQLMNEKPFSLNEALNVAIQIAGALSAAHAGGIVHRDIKPENIMLRSDGYVKILDFGLAKLTEAPTVDAEAEGPTLLHSNPGLVMGTVQYMSPEQARGRKVDARTDIWSLGVVLYELVAGRVPFTGETPSHVMVSLMEHELPALTDDAKVPAELDRIVTKALRKDKKERYQTTKELAHDLKNLKQELQIEARLKRSSEGASVRKEIATKTGGKEDATATPTVDIGVVRPTSSAEYLVSEIKRHKGSAIFASAILILAITATAYFSYFRRLASGETIDSVAVLPFVNSSNDANTEYLSDGISDSIIDSLSHLPNLKRVIPFSSVLRFKGKQIDPLAVGRELNVRAVLTGRLVQHGDYLSVSAELLDIKDNKLLWGGHYNPKSADIPNLQGEIAREISEKLRLKLTAEQKEQLTKRYTENTEAYQLYLQGRYYLRKFTDEGRIKSLDYLQKAIEKDPNFALGYAGLSRTYFNLAVFGQMRPKEAWQKSEEAAVKALAIDDGLVEAHYSLGRIKGLYDWDWAGAEREFKRAIELNPESADSHRGYADLLKWLGRFDEAIAETKRANQIDPLAPVDLVETLYFARRYDEAAAEGLKKLEERSGSPGLYFDLAEVYVQQGRYQEALAEMPKARALLKTDRQLARIGYVYAAAGKRDEATRILTEVKGLTRERYDLGAYIAAIYAALGNKDQAFAWLNKACDARERGVFDLKVGPRWDPLRSDPRFNALLWRMKLAS